MLRKGEAEVTLYTGTSVAGNFKITDCSRSVTSDGNWWHVFTIDGKTNKVKWGGGGTPFSWTRVGPASPTGVAFPPRLHPPQFFSALSGGVCQQSKKTGLNSPPPKVKWTCTSAQSTNLIQKNVASTPVVGKPSLRIRTRGK